MSLAQHFLAASPHLTDPNFYQTVVLMVQHNDDGALGLVLNRPLSKSLAEIWTLVGGAGCNRADPLMRGGPVEGPLLCLHSRAEWGEWEVLSGVYLSSRKELLDKLVQSDEPLRVFTGYAGWGPSQLERELELGGWLTIAASREDIFSDAATMWKRIVDRIGRQILEPVVGSKAVSGDAYWWN